MTQQELRDRPPDGGHYPSPTAKAGGFSRNYMTQNDPVPEVKDDDIKDGAVQFIASNRREGDLAQRLNALFVKAANLGSADIHMESRDDKSIAVRLRNRDGDMVYIDEFPAHDATLIFNKIRYRSNLSTVDTRGPQDSRIRQDIGDRLINVRVSIVPTVHGSTVVMRLLDPANSGKPIESLFMPPRVEKIFRHVIHSPEGLILSVGPTGSGKTTTLYTALNLRNEPSVKIVTAEDPVEYMLSGAQQVEIGPGRTFAQVLRAFLRQDPDIILVGEIRDHETISTALQAGQTGHLVLSTLHANNTFEALERMIEMGAKPQTLRSALRAVVAQRLVRVVCSECAEQKPITDPEVMALIQSTGQQCTHENIGKGCEACNHTGYRGRRAIYEMLLLDKPTRIALISGDMAAVAEAAKRQGQFTPLLPAAIELVRSGITNMNEVQRVVVDL